MHKNTCERTPLLSTEDLYGRLIRSGHVNDISVRKEFHRNSADVIGLYSWPYSEDTTDVCFPRKDPLEEHSRANEVHHSTNKLAVPSSEPAELRKLPSSQEQTKCKLPRQRCLPLQSCRPPFTLVGKYQSSHLMTRGYDQRLK